MPLQKPTSCIISRSYWVRMRRRWASSSLPSFSNHFSRCWSSSSIWTMARFMRMLAGHVVGGGEDLQLLDVGDDLAGEGVDPADALDLVAEQLDAHAHLVVGGEDLDGVAPHPELAPDEVHVVALVLHVDQPAEDGPLGVLLARLEAEDLGGVLLGRAQAVDARHAGHHDHVPSGEEAGRGGVAEAVDLVVDRRVLLDVGVARGDVGLGLVVVVVGDEVLDPVVGEELLELVGQLGRERLVGRDDERGLLHRLDRPGDGGRLPAARDAQQRLEPVAPLDPPRQPLDGLGLVAARLEVAHNPEGRHPPKRTTALRQPTPNR